MMFRKNFKDLIIIITLLVMATWVSAQNATFVACDTKITAEFVGPKEVHAYEIKLTPGQTLEVKVVPTGDYLNFRVELFDPVGSEIINDNSGTFGDPNKRNLTLKSGILSGRGAYKVQVVNFDYYERNGRAGEYTIQFVCINP